MKHAPRNIRLYLRVNEREQEKINYFSALAGMSKSAYVRKMALKFRVRAKLELSILHELRRQGGLLKLVHEKSQGIYSAEVAAALNAITSYACALEREIS